MFGKFVRTSDVCERYAFDNLESLQPCLENPVNSAETFRPNQSRDQEAARQRDVACAPAGDKIDSSDIARP